MALRLLDYQPRDSGHIHKCRTLWVHVCGGKRIHLTMDIGGLDDVGERLRRERALIGQMTFSDDDGEHVRDVLIPSNRVDFVVDADD